VSQVLNSSHCCKGKHAVEVEALIKKIDNLEKQKLENQGEKSLKQ
jgi:hypothetical protein